MTIFHRFLKYIFGFSRRIYYLYGGGNRIKGIKHLSHSLLLFGKNNSIDIRSRLPKDVKVVIYGNNHKLVIEENVTFKEGQIWFEDYSCEMIIKSGTTIENAELSVAEQGTKLIIGKDCMLSKDIHIATTDSHSIIDMESGKRTNIAQDIIINNHVWVGHGVSINKGVSIGENSVIAARSVVTKSIPDHSIAAGIPAKVVKTKINWDRTRI